MKPVPALDRSESDTSLRWWRGLTRYQWSVFMLAALGWMFDCFDQQIFTMSRSMSMRELVPEGDLNLQNKFGGYATTAFILGWLQALSAIGNIMAAILIGYPDRCRFP